MIKLAHIIVVIWLRFVFPYALSIYIRNSVKWSGKPIIRYSLALFWFIYADVRDNALLYVVTSLVSLYIMYKSDDIFYNLLLWLSNNKYRKFLLDNAHIDVNKNDEYLFRLACKNNDLVFAQHLYNYTTIDIHALMDDCYYHVCVNKDKEFIQWLFGLSNPIYTPYLMIMLVSRSDDNASAIRWLYERYKSTMPIHVRAIIFDNACKHGHLKTLKTVMDMYDYKFNRGDLLIVPWTSRNQNVLLWLWKPFDLAVYYDKTNRLFNISQGYRIGSYDDFVVSQKKAFKRMIKHALNT